MFKKELIEYLKKYPVISFTDFKKYGNEVYNKSEYEFEFSENFYSNFIIIGEKHLIYLPNILFLIIKKLLITINI